MPDTAGPDGENKVARVSPRVSIILPVLNEAKVLPVLLKQLQRYRRQGHELVVVDGGSRDGSLQLARQAADQVVVSPSGRARQMNAGAEVASGDILLFLHADTLLPQDALSLLSACCRRTGRARCWGRFDVTLSGRAAVFRLIGFMMNLRSRLTGIATGDQAIFVSAELFRSVNGFPDIALMEDIALSRTLRRICRPCALRARVMTSSRRWEQNGIVTTVLLMWTLRLLYFFGVSPERLRRMYR